MFLLAFPLFVVLSFGCLVLSYSRRFPVLRASRPFWWSIFIGLFVTYLVSLAAVFANPYWIDNEVEERIEFPAHFGWALFCANFYQLIIVPVSVGVFMTRKLMSRTKRSNESC